jgi:O-antigen/teichoic acid export membrane protein
VTTSARTSRSALAAAAFLAGSVLVHAGNYGFNLVAVRTLSAAQYADVALAVTLLLVAGFVTLGFQMATARTVAELGAESTARSVAGWLSRRAVRLGAAIGAATLVLSPVLQNVFQTQSVWPFVAIGIAMPWALLAGVRRGFVQGRQQFGRLALSFQAEMVARLIVGAGLIVAGLGVIGGVLGLAVSLVAAALALPKSSPANTTTPDPELRRATLRSIWPVLALLLGEAIVTHGDMLIVKQAFDPTTAGEFAAIALLGRAIFFVTWPVSMLIFPIATRRTAGGESTRLLLLAAVLAVAGVGGLATAAIAAAPADIVGAVLGSQYAAVASWLVPYAAATTFFSVAATALSFGVAVGRDAAGFGAAGVGVAVAVALAAFHPTIEALLAVELLLMAAYALGAVGWAWRVARRRG